MATTSRAPTAPTKRAAAQVSGLVVAGMVLLFLAGWAGWALKGASTTTHPVTVSRTFDGTVTHLNGGSAAGCVRPDGGGQVCSGFAIEGGGTVKVGDKVHVAYEWVPDAEHGSKHDLLVLFASQGS